MNTKLTLLFALLWSAPLWAEVPAKAAKEEQKDFPSVVQQDDSGEKKLEPDAGFLTYTGSAKPSRASIEGKCSILTDTPSVFDIPRGSGGPEVCTIRLHRGVFLITLKGAEKPYCFIKPTITDITWTFSASNATVLVNANEKSIALLEGKLSVKYQEKDFELKAGQSFAQVLGKGFVVQPTAAAAKATASQMQAELKKFKPLGKTTAKK